MPVSITQQGSSGASTTPKGINNNLYNLQTPERYSSLYDFIDEVNDPDVRSDLHKTFGNQGITEFLRLVGAVKEEAMSDSVIWWEEARLHQRQSAVADGATAIGAGQAGITFDGVLEVEDGSFNDSTSRPIIVRQNDIILLNGTDRCFVSSVDTSANSFVVKPLLTGGLTVALTDNATYTFPIVGNMHGQGGDQPGRYMESNVVKRENPFFILKDDFKVTGSQATNVGYIEVSPGDFRWFMKGEADTRQRFENYREMIMLTGQEITNTANITNIDGTEGYISALEDRGLVTDDVLGTNSGFEDVDALIKEMDKNGCPGEYGFYTNTDQDLLIDNMLATGIGTGTSAGLMGSFGAFNNDKDMAVNLGFKSWTRGSYTFHKHGWKLLNDPTLLGSDDVADNLVAAAAIPLANIKDAKTGESEPALQINYKSYKGYSREMEHWYTGSIMGTTNSTEDLLKFHYRSECNMITRGANKHILVKGRS